MKHQIPIVAMRNCVILIRKLTFNVKIIMHLPSKLPE